MASKCFNLKNSILKSVRCAILSCYFGCARSLVVQLLVVYRFAKAKYRQFVSGILLAIFTSQRNVSYSFSTKGFLV